MNDSSGVKSGLSLTDRTHPSTRTTVKTPGNQLAPGPRDHFKFELMLEILFGYGQEILLIKSLRDFI
jgi:hypothetical protein